MPIQHQCQCGSRIKIPDHFAGKSARCPKCQQPFQVPAAEALEADEPSGRADGPDGFGFDAAAAEAQADPLQPVSPAVATMPVSGPAQPAPVQNPWGTPYGAQQAAPQQAKSKFSNQEIFAMIGCLVTAFLCGGDLMMSFFGLMTLLDAESWLEIVYEVHAFPTALVGLGVGGAALALYQRVPWAKKAGGWVSMAFVALTLVGVLISAGMLLQLASSLSDNVERSRSGGVVGMAIVFSLGMTVFLLVVKCTGPMLMISLFFKENQARRKAEAG